MPLSLEMLRYKGRERMRKLRERTDPDGLLSKQADIPPRLEKPVSPVSKEYDAVRYVYQRFVDYDLEFVSWKEFQKHFQQMAQKYTKLFTEVRHNRPQITQADLKEWLDAHVPDESNYEIEHDTYHDADTSYRDVKQLVMKINQSASAAKILGEDPVLSEYLSMVGQGSRHSGHPAGEKTVGWLRVDFVNDDWILVDEVQSDLVNSITQAKAIVEAPSLRAFMQTLSPKAREIAREKGIDAEHLRRMKQHMQEKGFTVEKLEDIKGQIVRLFRDWVEYGIASLIELARRQGITNVAIHTAETIAERDETMEADKVKIYYDNLAHSFGFRKQPLDVGGLHGNFWVRTAANKGGGFNTQRGEKTWIGPDGKKMRVNHNFDTHESVAINKLNMTADQAMAEGWIRKVDNGVYHVGNLTPQAISLIEKDVISDNPEFIHIRVGDDEMSFDYDDFIEEFNGDLKKAISRSKFHKKQGANREAAKQTASLYHVTFRSKVPSIIQNGLLPNQDSNWYDPSGYVFLTSKAGLEFWLETAREYAEQLDGDTPEETVVLRVSRKGLSLTKDETGSGDAMAPAYKTDFVPPENIKVMGSDKEKAPQKRSNPTLEDLKHQTSLYGEKHEQELLDQYAKPNNSFSASLLKES